MAYYKSSSACQGSILAKTARLIINYLTYSQIQITFINRSALEYYDQSPEDIVILIIILFYEYSLTMYRRRPTICVKG